MRWMLLAIGFALGLGLGALKWRSAPYPYIPERISVLLSQAKQVEPGGVLVIGDSTAELIWLTSLCDKPVFNAGVSGAKSSDWLPHAERMIEIAKPALVILAVGTNDKAIGQDYRKLASLADFAVQPANKSVAEFIRTVPAPTLTVDGIHPSAEGARQWKRNVEAMC